MDKIIVGLIIAAAVYFLIDRVKRSVKEDGCCSGGCSCGGKADKQKKTCC